MGFGPPVFSSLTENSTPVLHEIDINPPYSFGRSITYIWNQQICSFPSGSRTYWRCCGLSGRPNGFRIHLPCHWYPRNSSRNCSVDEQVCSLGSGAFCADKCKYSAVSCEHGYGKHTDWRCRLRPQSRTPVFTQEVLRFFIVGLTSNFLVDGPPIGRIFFFTRMESTGLMDKRGLNCFIL